MSLLVSLAPRTFGRGFVGYFIHILMSLLVISAYQLCLFLSFHFPAAVRVLDFVLFSKKERLTSFSTNVDFRSLHELLLFVG